MRFSEISSATAGAVAPARVLATCSRLASAARVELGHRALSSGVRAFRAQQESRQHDEMPAQIR
jgi:hypothetical protein